MTDRDLFKHALEALEALELAMRYGAGDWDRLSNALRERLAQPFVTDPCQCGKESFGWCMANSCHKAGLARQEQQQVAWMDAEGDVYRKEPPANWCPPHTPLYAGPRQWQGLAKLEFQQAVEGLEDLEDCWIAIEAALREKNA